jgi:ribosome-binding protein aMBF1 (putative translation factor)
MPLTDPEIRAAYGRRIADARRRAELSQSDLASQLASLNAPVTAQAVSRWESGAVAPRLSVQRALTALFGADLFDIDGEAA